MAFQSGQRNQRRGGRMPTGAKWGIAAGVVVLLCGLLAASIRLGWLKLPGSGHPETTPPTVQPSEDRVIHLVAGGDLTVTDRVVASGASGYSDVFLDVVPVLSGGDLTVLNFEGNLYGEPYGTLHCSAPQTLAEALRNAGVDILQTANSKSIANGILGLSATVDGIRAAGMQSLGTYADSGEFERWQGFVIREVNGIRIALTAFTKGMDGSGLPAGSEDCVNLLYQDYSSTYQKVDEAGITRVLKAIAAEKPDLTIAFLHWGSEFNDQISTTQKKIIKLMGEQGVDAIIGTHPHYVQKMGFDEETGMFIAYSLGDFFGDGDKAGTDYSVLLDLEITRSGTTGKTAITGYDYTPIYRYEDPEGAVRLLRIREAMAAYESNCIERVTDTVYENMKAALTRIQGRVEG